MIQEQSDNKDPSSDCCWYNLLHQSKAALVKRNYDQAIQCSTASMQEWFKTFHLELLNIRATARGQQGLFESALADAHQMIEYAPARVIGYLRVGSLYVAQGKSDSAIKVYEQGLQRLPGDQQLITARKEAAAKHQKRWDFVSSLPLEIVVRIFACIDMASKRVALTVSKRWRDRLLPQAELWNTINASDINSGVAIGTLLPMVSRHVLHMKLTVSALPTKHCRRLLSCLENNAFTTLRSLSLSSSITAQTDPEYLVVILWQVRHTIVSLHLEFGPQKSAIALSTILGVCTNLTTLLFQADALKWKNNDNRLPGSCHLRDLKLDTTANLSKGVLEAILKRCPKLQRLYINQCAAAILFRLINTYCSQLSILGANKSIGDELTQLQYNNSKESGSNKGLRLLNLGSTSDLTPLRVVMQFLSKIQHQKTLEDMTICLLGGQTDRSSLHRLSRRYRFDALRSLCIKYYGVCNEYEAIADFIWCCPVLQDVSLVDMANIPATIFNALGGLQQLRSLTLDMISETASFQEMNAKLFGKHQERGSQSSLQKLCLYNVASISFPIAFNLASRLKNLQVLEVTDDFRSDSALVLAPFFNTFVDKAAEQLTSLRLTGSLGLITDYMVAEMEKIPHLQSLELLGTGTILDDGMIRLFADSRASVKHIKISRGLISYPEVVMDCAKKQGKRLIIV